MSLADFCRCTPSEFRHISDAWARNTEQKRRDRWERTRMLCLCSLQPYSRSRLSPADIMQFPWDKAAEQDKEKEEIGREELYRRFAEAKRKAGLI